MSKFTHLVHFNPIPVPEDVAMELSSPDPYGLRVDLEIELLKEYCSQPIGTAQEREPFPQIADVTAMSERAKKILNGHVPATVHMVRDALHGKLEDDTKGTTQ